MQEIYLLDIIATEGKKEVKTTKEYKTKKDLLDQYNKLNIIFNKDKYLHSKGFISLLPKIILIEKKEKFLSLNNK